MKLSEPAFTAWLRFRIWNRQGELKVPLRHLIKRLKIANATFYAKVITPLYDHGLIELQPSEKDKRCMCLQVYDTPQNIYENAFVPLKRYRSYQSSPHVCFTDCNVSENETILMEMDSENETISFEKRLKNEPISTENRSEIEAFSTKTTSISETSSIFEKNAVIIDSQNETFSISEQSLSYLYKRDLLKDKEKEIRERKDQIDLSLFTSPSFSSLPPELQTGIQNNPKLHSQISEITELYYQFKEHPLFSLMVFSEKMNLCREMVKHVSNYKSYFQKALFNLWGSFNSALAPAFAAFPPSSYSWASAYPAQQKKSCGVPEWIIRQEEQAKSGKREEEVKRSPEDQAVIDELLRQVDALGK